MTGYYGRGSPKLKSENINVTPMNSPVANRNSLMRKYLRSDNDENQFSSPKVSRPMRSPLSAVENIQMSPMKVEDEVVVMDGFSIGASKRNVGRGGKSRSSVNSDSSGKSSTGSNSGGSGYKMEKCQCWEKSGKCRHGSKCQYAHAQEELRPLGSRLNNRNSLEPIIRQPYLSPQSSNSSPINSFAVRNLRSASSVNAKATSNLYRASPSPSPSPDHTTVSARTSTYHSALSVPSSPSPSPSQPPNRSKVSARPSPNRSMVSELTTPYHSAVSVLPSPSPSPSPSQSPNHSMVSELTTPYHSAVSVLSSPSPNRSMVSALDGGKGLSTNWSPLDDGINASDPMSREDADHYIHMVLYGPTQSKRLPVFVDICSECNSLAHLSL